MAIYESGQRSAEWEAERDRLAAQRNRLLRQRAQCMDEYDRLGREYEHTCKQLAQLHTVLIKE